jgi:phosphatidylinositol alpha-mannosyltransferase
MINNSAKNSVLRIGMVSPYGWDTPGGVQAHIRDLAKYYIDQGHYVSVLAPVSNETLLMDDFVVPAGRPISIPYNGAVARVLFGPVAASRVRQWISQGNFDLLHLHEPAIPSLSLLACWLAEGPMVGTFHAAAPRQKVAFAISPLLEPVIEKLSARIAVSEVARETLKIHLETDAVVIPNGIDVNLFRKALPKDEWQDSKTIGFIGRFEEPRKGLQILLDALPIITRFIPDAKILIAGPGDSAETLKSLNAQLRNKLVFLGRVSEADKASLLKSVDLYVAPNTGGESFGIILTEALASETAIVASDIPAFRHLLNGGEYGALFESESATELAKIIIDLLRDDSKRKNLANIGFQSAERFDWSQVAEQIMDVYSMALTGGGKVGLTSESRSWNRFFTRDND